MLVYACSIFLISGLILLKFEIKDLDVMPSSYCKLRDKERHSLFKSVNKIFDRNS